MMNMFRVIQKRTGRISGYYKPERKIAHKKEILIFSLFIIGFMIGVTIVRTNNIVFLDRTLTLFRNYTEVKAKQSIFSNFGNALFKSMILLIITYTASLCAVGTPFLYFIPWSYGVIIGLISAYLYTEFALKGIGYCALLIYPYVLFNLTILIISGSAGLDLSSNLLKHIIEPESDTRISFRSFNLRYVAFILSACVAAIADAALQRLFSGYFIFS